MNSVAAVNKKVEGELKKIFGENVRTDRVERKMYSFDVGAMPPLIKPIMPIGLPGAVVRPTSEEEIVKLMNYAKGEGLRLVPRGASTSGLGGVLPQEGAIVVDTSGMNKVLEIDVKNKYVRVQPGIIWQNLQNAVNKEGLDLRLYPTSLPSSTVAGWLAQGGSGIGSYEYGSFKENVIKARVVLPNGEVKTFIEQELLDYVADVEGITGIITEIVVALRTLEPEIHRAVAFNELKDANAALNAITESAIPIWNITLLNPESMKVKKKLPHKHGHPYEEANPHYVPELPIAYIMLIVYPQSRKDKIEGALDEIIKKNNGNELPKESADHEWDLRFAPMRLKRIGPSIIPAEVVIPIKNLGRVLDEIDKKVKQPFVLEAFAAGKDNMVLLGFIPHDERTFAFNLAYGLSLAVLQIAKKHGGSAYGTGLYFRQENKTVLGEEKVKALSHFKEKFDPKKIMNPNKVLGFGLVNAFMNFACAFEPIVRIFANAAKVPTGDLEHKTKDKNGIPGNVAFFATACARCGYCVSTCEQFSGRGWESHSPRGKYYYIREVMAGREKFDQDAVNRFLLCTTCEMCNTRCQLNIPVEHNWMTMRGTLINEEKKMTFPPFEMITASIRGQNNIWAGKREKRADWVPEDIKPKIKEKADVLYFAGCTASYVNSDVAQASLRILDKAGIDFTYMGTDEACCGIPMKVSGKWDVFEQIFEHNVAEARKRGAKTIVTSCPACALVWKEMYPQLARKKGQEYEFNVKHYSEIAAEAIKDGKLKFDHEVKEKVAFHDSCHLGRAQGIYEPPRELLKAVPGVELVEMEHNREKGLCCGSVLTLIGEPAVAPKLGGNRLQEAIDVDADRVIALCPCCQVQLRASADKNKMNIPVTDLAKYVAQGLGYDIEDKSDTSLEMWGYFEKFIDLMEPKNMAKVMAALFPQMFKNMPMGMVPMMKTMKYIPGGLKMMGKMMPIMMPMLVPGIMPKVMPDMLNEVSKIVGQIPKDMEELMPDLLPKTMDAIMKNYLPLLIPYITPMMLEYIKTGKVSALEIEKALNEAEAGKEK